jgi:polar amino acid transport system substrate-binding protein
MRPSNTACAALAAVALLAGCTTTPAGPKGHAGNPASTPSPIPPPTGLVAPGVLTVASDPDYPPKEYLDGAGHFVGFDIDLARALATRLGLRLNVINVNVDGIVPAFAQPDRRFDLGISSQPETPDLTATARTLEYFLNGQGILMRAADHRPVAGPDDLCGLRVGAAMASQGEAAMLQENERPCKANPIRYTGYKIDLDAVNDLAAGRLDAVVDDRPVTEYFTGVFPGLRVAGRQFATSVDVMVFPPGDTAVHPAVAAALGELRADGTYARLLSHWKLSDGYLG